MSKIVATRSLAILLAATFIVPAAFFIAPQQAFAQTSGLVSCTGGALAGAASIGSNAGAAATAVPTNTWLGNLINTVTAGTTAGTCVTELIIKPIARQLIRQLIQQITSNTICWIKGGGSCGSGNGTGQPSFVVNLSLNLQQLGDSVVLPFIAKIRMVLNPAFGASIASSLLTNYAQQTSVGGFLAANQSTLGRVSPNPSAFMGGTFSQGGIPAWFSLTTQNENNPYALYYAADRQLDRIKAEAQTNRKQDLTQSGGFLSWCGTTAEADAKRAAYCAQNSDDSDCNETGASGGTNPGDTCTDQNGVSGTIKTPGSVIHDFTKSAVTDAGLDQLVNSNDLDSAIGAIISALVNTTIDSLAGGLSGSASASSIRPQAITSQIYSTATNNTNSINNARAVVNNKIASATTYTTAWTTIGNAANSASTQVTALGAACASQWGAAAQLALGTIITPLITQSQTNLALVSVTQTFAQTVLQEAASNASTLSADVQTLSAMMPTPVDMTTAQTQSITTAGAAVAIPTGSLGVLGGSYVDQMNLIATNAQALSANCSTTTPP